LNSQLQTATGLYGGKNLGAIAVMVKCPCHVDKTASLKLWIKDDGRVGNYCFAGCQFDDVDAALVSAGIQQPFKPGHNESPFERQQREHRQAQAIVKRAAEQAERDRIGTLKAVTIYSGTIEIKGTLGAHYLDGRFIKWRSPDVRFHEELYCGKTGKKHPAIVALLRDGLTGNIQAIQKIYLYEDDSGLVTCIKPKITVGPMAGAAVQIAPVTNILALAEGPESAISYWQMTTTPTWATCGTANLSKVHIPPNISRLVIAGDNDDKGREAAHKAAAIYVEQGFSVEIHLPPTEGHDWNNHLIERGASS